MDGILGGAVSDATVTCDTIAGRMVTEVRARTREAVSLIDMSTWSKVIMQGLVFEVPEAEAKLILSLIAKAKGEPTLGEAVGKKRGRRLGTSQSDTDTDDESGQSVQNRKGGGGGRGPRNDYSPGAESVASAKRRENRSDYTSTQHDDYVEFMHGELQAGKSINTIMKEETQHIADMCNKETKTVKGHFKRTVGGCKQCPNWLRQLLGQPTIKLMGGIHFPVKWDDYKTNKASPPGSI